MTDNEKMREAFERDHGPLSDDKDMQKYFARHECAMKWAWQAAKSVPHYDPSTAEVPPPGHPLQMLGEYLAPILDEDQWATAEQHLLAAWAGFSAKSVPVVGEPVAYGVPNSRPNESSPLMQVMLQIPPDAQYPGLLVPLIIQPTHSITTAELELMRQWFDCVQDVNGGFLNPDDFVLAKKLYEIIGMRVPHSIIDAAIAAEETGNG